MRSSVLRAALPLSLAAAVVTLGAFATLADSTDTPTSASPTPTAAAPADASSRFRALVGVTGGNLEQTYAAHAARLQQQTASAEALRRRVAALDSSGQALLTEWEGEISAIGSDSLRRLSQVRLDSARAGHARQVAAMRRAETTAAPALAALRDRTLALKHALNARAAAGLGTAATTVTSDATRIRQETERAVAEADRALAAAPR